MNKPLASAIAFFIAMQTLSALPQLAGDTVATSAHHPVQPLQDGETSAQRDQRMKWWREARFGMFIHWGLYSIPAGIWNGHQDPHIGEWIMNDESIPVADYKALAKQFNPTAFSAHDIVLLARQAGMKYIVVTAKHHDGFAMFDSKADPFNIMTATPFHRDPIGELAIECKKQGMKLGFYYSQDQDWTAPGGAALKKAEHKPPTFHWDKAQDGDFATYLHEKAIPQLKELLTNYGEFPSVVWFDTPTNDMTPELAGEIVTLLNQHPNLIWNNRLGGGYKGDIDTPEQYIPATGFPGRDWEACMTMNDTWGFKSTDTKFKSTQTLLRNLIDIASKGGNYLLNIGPDSTGQVPAAEVDRLKEIGQWLEVNGESIYGTGPTLFNAESPKLSDKGNHANPSANGASAQDWRSTTAPDKIYIELFVWPHGQFHLDRTPREIKGAYLLSDKKKVPLRIKHVGSGIDIGLPATPPNAIASVLVLNTSN